MIKQPPLSLFSGTPPTGSAAHNRLQGASSSNLMPRQCSLSQMSEAGSGLAATNCRADQDGCEMSGPSWAGSPPSSSWLTKAASTHSQPSASVAPSTPVPPAADEQVSTNVRNCMSCVHGQAGSLDGPSGALEKQHWLHMLQWSCQLTGRLAVFAPRHT